LFISRIHPKKNLGPLIAAWRSLAGEGALPAGARLMIAGWGELHDVAAFEAELASAPPSLRFIGPCFGDDKARELAAARFVILPSLSEGLPMTLLEAWAAGTPTLQSTECNLPEGFAAGAALDCGMDTQALRAALLQAFALSQDRWLAMAAAARKLASDSFSPQGIARQWVGAYAGLLAGTAKGPPS
jgi:poly(glycerol-phosphate) alpha-glucosyltransferase